MIQGLNLSSVSFKGSEAQSARNTYEAKLAQNNETIQQQNERVDAFSTQLNKQIPMQGVGEKLDVMA